MSAANLRQHESRCGPKLVTSTGRGLIDLDQWPTRWPDQNSLRDRTSLHRRANWVFAGLTTFLGAHIDWRDGAVCKKKTLGRHHTKHLRTITKSNELKQVEDFPPSGMSLTELLSKSSNCTMVDCLGQGEGGPILVGRRALIVLMSIETVFRGRFCIGARLFTLKPKTLTRLKRICGSSSKPAGG